MNIGNIPPEAFEQHIAVLGKTGAGKTNTVKLMIERQVAAGARVCVLDPIKSDHWGLTSSASGKSPGLPFCILGGPKAHAHLPGTSGAVIGSLVASGELPLSIIDMADLGPKEHSGWFLDFAETLLRQMSGVLYLVMEEADTFAPKERFGTDRENMRLHWSSRIARTGRSKGVRLVMACTRIQKIHNDMLGSCETLIAHRVSTPADRKPIIEWLSVNASPEKVAAVGASISNLNDGEAWVCYPQGGYINRVQFPRITTYDNSKTPAHGDAASSVTMAAIDIGALRRKLDEASAAPEPPPAPRRTNKAAEIHNIPIKADTSVPRGAVVLARHGRPVAAITNTKPPKEDTVDEKDLKRIETAIERGFSKMAPDIVTAAPPRIDPGHTKGKVGLSDLPHRNGDFAAPHDEEAMYQRFKARLTKEAPTLLRVLTVESEIEVKIERRTIEAKPDSWLGMVALLTSQGFIDKPTGANAVWKEAKRVWNASGIQTRAYEALEKLATMGFLTKEEGGYQAVPAAKKRITAH